MSGVRIPSLTPVFYQVRDLAADVATLRLPARAAALTVAGPVGQPGAAQCLGHRTIVVPSSAFCAGSGASRRAASLLAPPGSVTSRLVVSLSAAGGPRRPGRCPR